MRGFCGGKDESAQLRSVLHPQCLPGLQGQRCFLPGLHSILFSCLLLCSFRIYGRVLLLVGIFSVIYFLPSVLFQGVQV